jgi:hypothetical protein
MAVAAPRSGTAIATWFSFPRDQREAGAEERGREREAEEREARGPALEARPLQAAVNISAILASAPLGSAFALTEEFHEVLHIKTYSCFRIITKNPA